MEDRSLKVDLLHEEGIALKDVSHHCSPVVTRPPPLPLPSSSNISGSRYGPPEEIEDRKRTLALGNVHETMEILLLFPVVLFIFSLSQCWLRSPLSLRLSYRELGVYSDPLIPIDIVGSPYRLSIHVGQDYADYFG